MNTVVVNPMMWAVIVGPVAWLVLVTAPLLARSAWTRGRVGRRVRRAQRAQRSPLREALERAQ